MANVTISKFSDGTNTGYIASQAYFSCSTPAGTAAKVATSPDGITFTDTSLVMGVTVHVYFAYANTATGTLTLKIGDSTAKEIAGTTSWKASSIVSFTYGGSRWYQNDSYTSTLGDADVGSTVQPIYLDNGVPKVSNPGDAYLSWGGRNLTSSNSPLDAALISTLGADRFAFIKPSAITVEYSQDAGATWSDYSLSDDTKARIFAPGIGVPLYLGAHSAAGSGTANDQLRITVDAATASVYTTIYKWVCYMSTNGHSNCTWSLQLRTTANVLNNVDTWVNGFQDVAIGGWSGINITNYQNTIGSNAPTSTTNTQYRQFRLIFKQGAGSASYSSSSIMYIMAYGGVGWNTPSNMARYNSLYSYDYAQNATFPANVTADKFITKNGTSSQFVKGDGSLDSNDYITASELPAAPGTLNTTNTASQATSANEALSGNINLHKISKTGDYGDLRNAPTYDASTGNLSSTTFTGSGAGLTDIPSNEINYDNLPALNYDYEYNGTDNYGFLSIYLRPNGSDSYQAYRYNGGFYYNIRSDSFSAVYGLGIGYKKFGICGYHKTLDQDNHYIFAIRHLTPIEVSENAPYAPTNPLVIDGAKLTFRYRGSIVHLDDSLTIIDTYFSLCYSSTDGWSVHYMTNGDPAWGVSLSPRLSDNKLGLVVGPASSESSFNDIISRFKPCKSYTVSIDYIDSNIERADASGEFTAYLSLGWLASGYTGSVTTNWSGMYSSNFPVAYIEGTRLPSSASVAWTDISGHDAGVDADLGINTTSGDTTKFLNAKGDWAVPTGTYAHPTYSPADAAAVKVGRDATGHVILGAALTAADVGAAASNHTHTSLTNDLTLLKSGSSSGDSYSLIFQRGTLTDNYNDWRIQDRGGFLRFDQRGNGSTSWSEVAYINTTGTVYSAAFSGSGASLTSLNASNISSGTLADARLPSTVEKVANKVTSVSSSSTDTEYPTAKAVYDLFASITDADNTSY